MKRVILLILLIGCSKSEPRASFDKLASAVNPVLEKLRPRAAQYRDLGAKLDEASRMQLAMQCSKLDPELQELKQRADLFYALDVPTEDQAEIDVPLRAALILVGPFGLCQPSGDVTLCIRECIAGWAGLTTAVDRLAEMAAKHDVKLITLR